MITNENRAVSVINDICEKSKKSSRENILKYEKLAKSLPQVNIPVLHHIHGGMYGREITIPKGTILTGQIYKFDHFDIMISGDITVSTDTDKHKRLTGFNIFKGLSGKKRAGYAHEDTRWVTFHPFDGLDGDDIQDNITVDNFDELSDFYIEFNRLDYFTLVESIGMTQEQITDQVESTEDMTELDCMYNHLYISDSTIEGKGFYSKIKYKSGSNICPARVKGNRTNAGRYCNHAVYPNAEIIINDKGDADLISIKNIESDEEITINYRAILEHRNLKGDLLCQE